MLYSIILALLTINACTASSRLQIRDPCDDLHYLCFPPEGEEYETPAIGKGIRDLLHDLSSSVKSPWTKQRDLKEVEGSLVERAPSEDLCCKSGSIRQRGQNLVATVLTGNAGFFGDGCYSLRKRRAPFCYNPYNTDFRLPGGFTGNLNTGRYESADGDRANLYHGNYILKDGTIGNIYHHGRSPADRGIAAISFQTEFMTPPATTTAAVETQVATIEGTTIPARTFYPGDTFPALIQGESTILPAVTFSAVIAEGTTIPERVLTRTRLVTILGEPVSIGSS